MKNSDYIVIQAFMVKELGLSGNKLILYALVHGYCKDGEHEFHGSINYICEWTNLTRNTVISTLKYLVDEGFLVKREYEENKVRFCAYSLGSVKIAPVVQNYENWGGAKNEPNKDSEITNNNLNNYKENIPLVDSQDVFVDRMYKKYPSKCPVRNTYLGKSLKDKQRIKSLLKIYSQEDIERVIDKEIEIKYGKYRMSNFSTFLNNFPDPSELFSNKSYGYPKDINDVKEEDVQHKLDFFNYWIEKKAPNVCDGLSNGRPQTEQQYKSLIEHTEGGARALCYVVLVLNRDGWEQYADERGFMWVYSNYIKANGLYKG